jgi:hypothetical protein
MTTPLLEGGGLTILTRGSAFPVCGVAARQVSPILPAPITAIFITHPSIARRSHSSLQACLKHGQLRIIVPIDDINDQH